MTCLAASTGCQNAGAAADAKQDDFSNGRALACEGKYQQAIAPLEKYLREQPRGKNASRAGLFLGKAHLALEDFPAAKKAFQMTIDNYATSLEAHKSKYKLAMIALLEGDHNDALARFTSLVDKPDGPLAAEALAWSRHLKAQAKAGAP
ncbi:MAG: tetratricopeptide repeat protein [Pirellulaceae bacterium]